MAREEKTYLVALSFAWIIPAWWLGASHAGGQWALLVLSCVALWLARRVCTAGKIRKNTMPTTQSQWLRLARWLPALFLVFLFLQACNHSCTFTPGWHVGTLQPQSYITWLPSGLATPFSATSWGLKGDMPYENAWRYLLIFGGATALVWATLPALARPQIARRWLEVMLVHAVLFSLVAMLHNISGSRLTYWLFYDPANRLGGPQFPNGNQQGAYQMLLLALVLAGAFMRGPLRPFAALRQRNLWMTLAVFAAWLGAATGRHRAGILLSSALIAIAFFLAFVRGRGVARMIGVGAFLAGAAALAWGFVNIPSLRETWHRFSEVSDSATSLLHGGGFRVWQHEVAGQMIDDAPWLGRGGGAFLYLYNGYFTRVPALAADLAAQRLNRIAFPHADGDWLEFLVEYGIIGLVLMMLSLAILLAVLVGAIFSGRSTAGAWMLIFGIVCVLAQAAIDPALRNPVVFSTVCGAAWLALKSCEAKRSVC